MKILRQLEILRNTKYTTHDLSIISPIKEAILLMCKTQQNTKEKNYAFTTIPLHFIQDSIAVRSFVCNLCT